MLIHREREANKKRERERGGTRGDADGTRRAGGDVDVEWREEERMQARHATKKQEYEETAE